ncbi:hypothetical protein RRF57_011807 [Xylaria bambusicola]|uniref:Uncharacterized protein n=1 Tax=Xylaria bambusicola TaxID=326684 RepID=A0AAN7Z414_9PEZI
MSSPAPNPGVYTSEKPQPPLPPHPIKLSAANAATAARAASRRAMATEINYPDPLPGGFQPGKKCCEHHPMAETGSSGWGNLAHLIGLSMSSTWSQRALADLKC